ncbi:site-2 protease family protein [Sedimentibacter sp. MB31-C6]|uniref:site-2 protease family protein n=1 Tax=Sedimentibacter sp. MB31-C6 TaxID=3109366 RepID=UPI002DDDB9E0|nr:site-2 protease family protein [Sedimentibacter sp. MB36-C1]WSI05516.1 site-2 protease family protein [Sedimentibacter sp. MB36-C1]
MDYLLGKLLILPGILLGISIHEFAHGYAAVQMGDNTPLMQGRLTLNPIKHLDPFGFLCLLLFGFGWAKPVMINSRNFNNPRRDDTIVSVAGPLANLIIAFIFTGLMKVVDTFLPYNAFNQILWIVLSGTVQINLVLMVFNLIPIPPLDGHHILGNIVGAPVWNFYYKYREHLRFFTLLLIVFGFVGRFISPMVSFFYNLLMNVFF